MKKAFTLSEILITLGIIGVVAAMTIPGLLTRINDLQNRTHWRKCYSVVNQAFKNVINREISVCAYTNCSAMFPQVNNANYSDFYFSNDFLEAFIEELNPIDMCYALAEPKCTNKNWANVKGGSYRYLNNPNIAVAYYNWYIARFLLKDGSVVYMSGSHGGPWLSVDVNGPSNGPNQVGRDLFIIKVFEDKILPMGAQGTFNTQYNGEKCLCGKQYGLQTSNPYFAGVGGQREVISGGCCSDYYIKNNK